MRSEKYAGVSSLELIVHRVSVSLQWTVSPAIFSQLRDGQLLRLVEVHLYSYPSSSRNLNLKQSD